MRTQASLLPLFASVAFAYDAPSYSGYDVIWQSTFPGAGGTSPDTSEWNIITGNLGVNGELETYTSSTSNLQNSGGATLQIVPWLESSGWTSGRVESTYTFTPAAGVVTMGESQIRFGSNPIADKQGLWPAFWLLGSECRGANDWPACGELDVLETIDGQLTGYGTAHCQKDPGGVCNEPDGLGGSIAIPDQSWHTWRITWDRTPSSWESESVTWYMDGEQFHQITGSVIGNETVWSSLCHNSMYFILNMAVGGSWVSKPSLQCYRALADGNSPVIPIATPKTATAA